MVIRPHGLLPECKYVVGFDSTPEVVERTGADLMANGITIKNQKPGELIYLNLPNRPGSGRDKIPPQPPGRVLARRETNIGHSGIGIYWSPGADDNWISYYEVRRDGHILDKVAIGNYYFDHAAGWDGRHEYAVRTVDGDGNVSGWTVAEPTAGEPLTFAALGGHFSQPGRDGWSAETTADDQAFAPDDVGAAGQEPCRRFRRNAESTRRSRRLLGRPGGCARRPRLATGLADRSLCPHLDGARRRAPCASWDARCGSIITATKADP